MTNDQKRLWKTGRRKGIFEAGSREAGSQKSEVGSLKKEVGKNYKRINLRWEITEVITIKVY